MYMNIKSILTFLCFLVFVQYSSVARPLVIKGGVVDTINQKTLARASVTLLRAADSVLIAFTRTKEDGSFELHPTALGKYILMTTFPNFVDYVEVVNVKDSNTINVGRIGLISRSHLLTEFVLKQQVGAIKIKGDTTEYMADSFKVKDNANVEDLLRRLPGMQIDKDGNVIAQGEKVEKILVDGEEFFSDDPAVVTKNLQANAIAKVQVFDKKSDQAQFTGIDDGQKTKTINLELKEDRKKGYFGKVDAGVGTDGYYQGQGMINAFKGKRQLSVFGIASNTGQVGLGWQDRDKFGSGRGGVTEITDGGDMVTYTSNSNDPFQSWDGKYNGQGLPTVWTGGLHYADKWNQDKDHLTANYRAAKQNVDIQGITTGVTTLDSSLMLNKQQKTQTSTGQRHSIDMMYERKIDSTSSIKFSMDAGYKSTQTNSTYNTDVTDTLTQLHKADVLSNSFRKIIGDATAQAVNSDLIYRKKFAKKGRTLSIDLKENYTDTHNTDTLHSHTTIMTPNLQSYINQYKTGQDNKLAFASKITYTEPLSKVAFLELNYGTTINNSSSTRKSYDTGTSGKYDVLDSLYSSNYKFNIFTNTGGVAVRFVFKNVNFSFGSDISNSAYKRSDVTLHKDTTYNYNNFFPKATFRFNHDKQSSVVLSYAGSTQQPTIDEIQPLHDNTNPLNIAVGNPTLKPEFHNSFTARYNNYKILTNRYLWTSASLNYINDAISLSDTVYLGGIHHYSYTNINGNYNAWGFFGYGFKLQKLDLQMGIRLGTSINHLNNFVNTYDNAFKLTSKANINDNNSYTFGLDFNYYKDKKYSFEFRPGIAYNDNHATINTTANTSYLSSDNEFTGSLQLPYKFELGTTVEWFLRQQTKIFPTNNNVLRWNAYLSKKFLKTSELELRAYVFDILNQNKGYDRIAQNNITTEDTYNTISRYGMLSLIWNFNKTPGASAMSAPAGGQIRMRRH
jgi:hypothetical protein